MDKSEAIFDFVVEKNLTDLQVALVAGADPNSCDESGRPLLHWAAQEGNAAIIRCLLEAGADVEARDDNGFTALAIAVGEEEDGSTEKTQELLKGGASPNTRISSNGGGSVLHLAASWGWFGIIKILSEDKGIELNLRDDEGHTPLYFAREDGSQEIIDFLIERGARD